NLSSAFFAALSAAGVERLSRRLGAAPLLALSAGLAFGVSPTLWSRAVEIEVFALNAAFVAAILFVCAGFLLSPLLLPQALTWRLALLAFLFGLSLTNPLTCLFLAPGCGLSALVAVRRTMLSSGSPNSAPSTSAPVPSAPSSSSASIHPSAFSLHP